jgi:hypothetical protein
MPPPEPVKCERCAQTVPKKNFCSKCGYELIPSKEWADQVLDPLVFANAAKVMKDGFDRINLATVQLIHVPEGGTQPQIKPVEIDAGTRAFIARSETSSLEPLPPGRYVTFEDLFDSTGGAGSIRNATDKNTCLFVKVNCRPITATFHLPDWQLLFDLGVVNAEGVPYPVEGDDEQRQQQRQARALLLRKTLEQLNLLSGDNLFGGALAQLELEVVNPQTLLNVLGDVMAEEEKGEEKKRAEEGKGADKNAKQGEELAHAPKTEEVVVPKALPKTSVGKMFRSLGRLIFGDKFNYRVETRTKRGKSQSVPFNFTLSHLYKRISLEFRMAVQQAIRDFPAMQLLENRDQGRDAVRAKIEGVMKRTLDAYGVRLNRCLTFEFICPELLTLQREKGETQIAEERFKEQVKRMKLNRDTLDLSRKEERLDQLLDFEDEKTELEQTGVLDEMKDKNRAAAQVRQLGMDATKGEHDREQLEKNKRLEIAMQKQAGLATNEVEADKEAKRLDVYRQYMDVQQGVKDQEFDKLMELAKVLPSLPPPMQQAMIAALKPELQSMFIAAYNASGLEQQIAMQRDHTRDMGQAHTAGTQQGVQLLTAIIQQAGHVLAANAAANQPPRQLPAADPDATVKEGGNQ